MTILNAFLSAFGSSLFINGLMSAARTDDKDEVRFWRRFSFVGLIVIAIAFVLIFI